MSFCFSSPLGELGLVLAFPSPRLVIDSVSRCSLLGMGHCLRHWWVGGDGEVLELEDIRVDPAICPFDGFGCCQCWRFIGLVDDDRHPEWVRRNESREDREEGRV